jgi:hypothetical protein
MNLKVLMFAAVFLLCAGAVHAQSLEDPFNNHWWHPCMDAATPDECMEWTSAPGVAPELVSCVSRLGCKQCFIDDVTSRPRCGTAPGQSGSCTCEVKTVTSGSGTSVSCVLTGSCTYRQ